VSGAAANSAAGAAPVSPFTIFLATITKLNKSSERLLLLYLLLPL
jgi:hypothetical protein